MNQRPYASNLLKCVRILAGLLVLAWACGQGLMTEALAQPVGSEASYATPNDAAAGINPDVEDASKVEQVTAPAAGETIPQGMGEVAGQVIDAETGNFIAEVTVVLEWQGEQGREEDNEVERQLVTTTDADGNFNFQPVPSGIYNVRFSKGNYRISTLKDLKVYPDKVTRADFPLPRKPIETAGDIFDMEEFEVTAESLEGSGDWLLDMRQNSAGMVNFLSTEDFAKFGGTDLSDIIQRIPGVTVVEGQFAVVRGLGDRYNSTLVNGLPMPSPDPVRQGLQLDLFPTTIIESVVTNKSFLPNMPSNSSGAAFELNTKSYPTELTMWFKAGVRFNSNAMDTFLKSPHASFDDVLANGAANRPPAPPEGTPALNLPNFTNRQNAVVEADAPMGLTFSTGIGNTIEVGGRDLGIIVSASYDSSYTTALGTQQNQYATPGRYLSSTGRVLRYGSLASGELGGSDLLYDVTSSTSDVLIGVLTSVGYNLDKEGNHHVSGTMLFSRNGIDFAQRKADGYLPSQYAVSNTGVPQSDRTNMPDVAGLADRGDGNYVYVNQDTIGYEQRDLYSFQLAGDHTFEEMDDLHLSWGGTYAHTSSDTPDQSVFKYFYNANTGQYFTLPASAIGGSSVLLQQTWRTIEEDLWGARADAEYNIPHFGGDETSDLSFAGGMFYSESSRNTEQFDSLFASNSSSAGTPQDLADVMDLVAQQPLASNASTSQETLAFYLMPSLDILDVFNVTGGARFEKLNMFATGDSKLTDTISLQNVLDEPAGNSTNGQLIGFTDASVPGVIDEAYILPGIVLSVEPLENLTFRAGYSVTVARPSFRELSPYFSRDLGTGDLILGNPNLKTSDVTSWDARVEYNFDWGGLLSVGAFYKSIKNPIEQIVIQEIQTGEEIQTFFNNPNTAQVKGLEFEARTSLGFIDDVLEYWSVGGNYTMIDAQVGYPDNVLSTYYSGTGVITSPYAGLTPPTTRRLYDQPEWIINADITYNNPEWGTAITLAYFSQSDVLSGVGSGSADSVDQYTDQFYQLDLTLSQALDENFTFKFRVANLTDSPRGVIYDPTLVNADTPPRQDYRIGQTYSISIEWKF
ncbi:MAG: TonB-dependent receptor [Verrucomicrobiota bacterium JB024]|nr:TonB-dependent receptor [Verrucomicrobiota bacterium JB024]